MTKLIRNFLNGLAFGITEMVPGVSASTIAIILGFYNELIETLNHFTKDYRKYSKFLVPLLLGIVIGMIAFSSVIHYLLTNFSFPTMAFFIGLIVGIIPLIFLKIKEPGHWLKLNEMVFILIPFIALLIISNLNPISVPSPEETIKNINIPFMFFLFLAGIIAAVALILPAVSGSFMLLLIGIYPLVIYSVSSLKSLLTDITNTSLLLDITKVLLPLVIGAIIGGLSMARLVEKLLKNHYKITFSLILGLLSASVCVLSARHIFFQGDLSGLFIVIGVATFLLGTLISFNLGKKRL